MYETQLTADGVDNSVKEIATWLYGNRGIAMTYVNLIPNLTLTFGISALPAITAAWAIKDRRQIRSTVESVLRITLLLAMPSGIGMAMLGKPLMYLIYNESVASVVGPLLNVLGIAVIFICLIAPINAIFQAVGRADLPVKIILVGGVVKLALNLILVSIPSVNIMGSAISTLACYVVMVVISMVMLLKTVRIRLHFGTVVLKPLVAALLCGLSAYGVNYLLCAMSLNQRISVLIALICAVIVYIFALLFLRILTKDDVLMLPKGEKIAQLLAKYHWIG